MENKFLVIYLLGIFIIVLGVGIGVVYNEINNARKFCNSINGSYHLKYYFLDSKHYCNDEEFVKVTDHFRDKTFWAFRKNYDYSNINLTQG